MPKLKTHRGAFKRFRKTSTGKLKREHAFTSHILRKKSRDRKRRLRSPDLVSEMDKKGLKRLLPYL